MLAAVGLACLPHESYGACESKFENYEGALLYTCAEVVTEDGTCDRTFGQDVFWEGRTCESLGYEYYDAENDDWQFSSTNNVTPGPYGTWGSGGSSGSTGGSTGGSSGSTGGSSGGSTGGSTGGTGGTQPESEWVRVIFWHYDQNRTATVTINGETLGPFYTYHQQEGPMYFGSCARVEEPSELLINETFDVPQLAAFRLRPVTKYSFTATWSDGRVVTGTHYTGTAGGCGTHRVVYK